MITIEIMGGLGNQLFQIFHLISYCLTHKVPFYFEYKEKPIREDRPYYWYNFLQSLKSFLKKNYETNLPIYREKGFDYNYIIPYSEIGKPFKFFGYFQSYKYFKEKEEKIFKLLKLDKQIENIKTKYETMCNFEKTISLHFRIGDYKNQQHNHPVMQVSYYILALKKIIEKTKVSDWNILYFYESQDVDLIKEKVNILQENFKNITLTPINTEIVDYEQMLLMSLCKHNIIANSSFSWWGAYLNKNKNKIIIYPNPNNWFGQSLGNKKMDDMFPESWYKILL